MSTCIPSYQDLLTVPSIGIGSGPQALLRVETIRMILDFVSTSVIGIF